MASSIELPEGFVLDAPVVKPVVGTLPEGFVIDEQPTEQPVEEVEQSTEQKFTAAELDANEILGVDPNIVERGVILPFGKNAQGETELAVPQIALDVARAVLLPGQALRGIPIEGREITEAALTGFAPATKGLLAGKAVTKAGRLTAEQIANAPSALDLTKASGLKFTASKQAGAVLKPDDYVGFLAGAERDLINEGIDSVLHPDLTAVFNALTKRIGTELDATELHKVRRTIGIATESLDRDEARIARVLRDNFDDFIENLPGTDQWREARKIYIQARKAETVESAINKAGNSATGLENGLRIQFRSLLNNPRKMRNFNKEEKAAMQAVVDGDFTTNSLKKIGRLSFGTGAQSGFLGGTIGIGAGGMLGGPAGAMIAPAMGRAAQGGAQRRTARAAETLRALIGGARPEAVTRVTDPTLFGRAAAGGILTGEESP